ncbi:MAG TPA: protein-tyrosine phosphatase family protein [Acidimicrobiales bacterium]|nr:protein-tyrosine phosphatase family protein [Acidimicrobiales bacterium]
MEGLHSHLDFVVLPSGITLTAASFSAGYERPRSPDFGLYLDERWAPPWPHAHIAWPDFGVPADGAAARAALVDVLRRASDGESVEIGCLGGHGRTGTALACLAVLAGVEPSEAVAWVRSHYCSQAVETAEQAAFVEAFS